jgi:hypothetical protein
MTLKKNVYVVFTEYQFLQALNIATSVYNSSTFINSIYLLRNGKRLQGIDPNKIFGIDNIKVHLLDFESPKKFIDLIFKEKPNHFLFFQSISAINIYMAYTLSKKGVEISLGPDGYGTYANFNKKHHFLSIIKDSLKENYYLFKNNLFHGKIHQFDYYSYGYHKFINNLWITHPDQFVHQSKNKVNILKLPEFNKKCIEFISSCFNFNFDFPKEDVIYFFNQPLWSALAEKEYQFLSEVVANFPEKNIIIKLHPLTDVKTKFKYQQIERVQIIESQVPAEVLLLSLNNCIVFSGWSTALITENTTCNYYFNYPIYKDLNDSILNQIDFVLLNHIKMIASPQEMKFPNE